MPPVYNVSRISFYLWRGIDTFTRLYLEEPDRDIDSDAQRSPGLLELVYGELGEGDPLAWTNFLVDAMEQC